MSLRSWAANLRRDVVALWLAVRHPGVPAAAKAVAAIVAAYALSPIDLIPDFIPVLGYLDDLILVPLGVWLAIRLVPPALMGDLRAEAARRIERPRSRAGAVGVVLGWLIAAGVLVWAFAA